MGNSLFSSSTYHSLNTSVLQCVWVFPIFSKSLILYRCQMSCNLIQFWHHLPRGSIRSHKLRTQSHKTAISLHMPIASPGCYLGFWLNSYKSEVPTTPTSFLIICQNGSQNSGSLCTRLLVYYEGYNSGRARWKRCIGQDTREGVWRFHALLRHATLLAPSCVQQPRSSLNPVLRDFQLLPLYLSQGLKGEADIYIFIRFLSLIDYYKILSSSMCYTVGSFLVIHFIFNSVYMLIPNS